MTGWVGPVAHLVDDEGGGPVPWLTWTPERHARVVRLCTAVTGDASAAADLAQETYLQAAALQAPGAHLDPWIDAVARNVCRRWMAARVRAARREHLTDAVPEPVSVDLEDRFETEDLAALVEAALGLLPASVRDVLVARYVDEQSPSDIAAASGTTPDAVSMKLTRAKRRLRHVLETRFAEEALSCGWTSTTERGWRATRVRCSGCGTSTLETRRDDEAVQFRCRACAPGHVSVVLPLRGRLGALGTDVVRPSAVLGRLADWSTSYWLAPGSAADCAACGAAVHRRPYERAEFDDPGSRHGWFTRCDHCGEEVSTSLAGLTGALPQTRAARRRHVGLRVSRSSAVVRDGVPALEIGLARADGRRVLTAVFRRDLPQLLHLAV